MKKTGIILLITAFSITFNATSSFAQLDDSSELESDITTTAEDIFSSVEESDYSETEVDISPELSEELNESPTEEPVSESSSLDSTEEVTEEVLPESEDETTQIDAISSATQTLNVEEGLIFRTTSIDDKTTKVNGYVDIYKIIENLPKDVVYYREEIMYAFAKQPIHLIANGNIVQSTTFTGTGNFEFKLNKPFVGGTTLTFYVPLVSINHKLTNPTEDPTQSYIQLEDTVRVVAGEVPQTLTFNSVPPAFNFNPVNFSYSTSSVTTQQQSSFNIEILDTRPNGQWTLAARLAQPLTNSNAHTMPANLLYGKAAITSTPVTLAKSSDLNVVRNNQLSTITLGKVGTEKFNLQFNPINAQAGTTYKLAIEWTLSDTASN